MSAAPPARPAVPGRTEVVAILAAFGERAPEDVPEDIDSMELAWLVHQLEQTYGGTVPDAALVRMTTVAAVLDEVAGLAAAGVFGPGADGAKDAAPPGAAGAEGATEHGSAAGVRPPVSAAGTHPGRAGTEGRDG